MFPFCFLSLSRLLPSRNSLWSSDRHIVHVVKKIYDVISLQANGKFLPLCWAAFACSVACVALIWQTSELTSFRIREWISTLWSLAERVQVQKLFYECEDLRWNFTICAFRMSLIIIFHHWNFSLISISEHAKALPSLFTKLVCNQILKITIH